MGLFMNTDADLLAKSDKGEQSEESKAESKALKALCSLAINRDTKIADNATTELREKGPEGLKALLTEYSEEIKAIRENAPSVRNRWLKPESEKCKTCEKLTKKGQREIERVLRIERAVNTVSAQYNAAYSGLYWYTDLDEAKKAAAEQKKPIISYHLLGHLDDEFC